jgi:hypothetical protein
MKYIKLKLKNIRFYSLRLLTNRIFIYSNTRDKISIVVDLNGYYTQFF